MEDKKRFFYGVTEDDIAEQERQQEAERRRHAQEDAVREAEEAQKRRNEERKAAYRKYIDYQPRYRILEKLSKEKRKDILTKVALFFMCWGVASSFGLFAQPERDDNMRGYTNRKLTLGQRLRDAFWPISNGWGVETRMGLYADGADADDIYTYNEDNKGKFMPRGVWWINMAFLLTGICIVIGKNYKNLQEIKEKIADNRYGRRYNKVAEEAVDMMMDLKDLAQELNLNDRDIETIVEMVPGIISKMAESERVYFDKLMSGEIDIQDNKALYGMAVAIMEGHLRKHPEDFEQILAKIDQRTIPQGLMNKYGKGRS